MRELISVKAAARLLGLKVPSIYKRTCEHSIPYIKMGSRVLFDPDKLAEWATEKTVEVIR